MSKRDFDRYFDDVKCQYFEMLDTLKEIEELANNQMVSPDMLDNVKATIEPIKNNYLALSYVMFLLNKPTRGSKADKYKRQNKKLLEQSIGRQEEDIKNENKSCINNLREKMKEGL